MLRLPSMRRCRRLCLALLRDLHLRISAIVSRAARAQDVEDGHDGGRGEEEPFERGEDHSLVRVS